MSGPLPLVTGPQNLFIQEMGTVTSACHPWGCMNLSQDGPQGIGGEYGSVWQMCCPLPPCPDDEMKQVVPLFCSLMPLYTFVFPEKDGPGRPQPSPSQAQQELLCMCALLPVRAQSWWPDLRRSPGLVLGTQPGPGPPCSGCSAFRWLVACPLTAGNPEALSRQQGVPDRKGKG